MGLNPQYRFLPFVVFATIALAYEPLRSGFQLANQDCDLAMSWQLGLSAAINLKHIASYGLLCLLAFYWFGAQKLLKAAVLTLLLSVLLEVEQSYFTTGHCKLRDVVPNIIGIGCVAALVSLVTFWQKKVTTN